MIPLLATALILSAPVPARQSRVVGEETTIPGAAGGFRIVEPEEGGRVVLVQTQRTLRWYRITLSGRCFEDRGAALIVVPAGPGGDIDRFTRVASSRMPTRMCGIDRIVNAAPPPKAGKRTTP